jgi:uncharacterized protein (TIGR01244 family)
MRAGDSHKQKNPRTTRTTTDKIDDLGALDGVLPLTPSLVRSKPMRVHSILPGLALCLFVGAGLAVAQEVTKETVPGIRNLARIQTTVACAGAITPEAVADVKKMGFVSIVNLRLASEPGAEVEKEEAAAKTAGIKYFHVPFDGKPDPKAAGAFLDAITTKGAEPAFIHCAGGNRAAAMWLIKRLAVDHWEVDRAGKEATALGLTSEALKTFAIEYGQANKR